MEYTYKLIKPSSFLPERITTNEYYGLSEEYRKQYQWIADETINCFVEIDSIII